MDASIGKSKFPLWAIIACAVGGAVAVAVLAYLTWACCCRRRPPRQGGSVSPSRPSHATNGSSAWTYSPGGHGYYSNGAVAPPPGRLATAGLQARMGIAVALKGIAVAQSCGVAHMSDCCPLI